MSKRTHKGNFQGGGRVAAFTMDITACSSVRCVASTKVTCCGPSTGYLSVAECVVGTDLQVWAAEALPRPEDLLSAGYQDRLAPPSDPGEGEDPLCGALAGAWLARLKVCASLVLS